MISRQCAFEHTGGCKLRFFMVPDMYTQLCC